MFVDAGISLIQLHGVKLPKKLIWIVSPHDRDS